MNSGDNFETAPTVQIPVVWFFLPLPDPLGLPNGWQCQRLLTPLQQLDADAEWPIASSLLIHQMVTGAGLLTSTAELYEFAASIMTSIEPSDASSRGPIDSMPLDARRTIAE